MNVSDALPWLCLAVGVLGLLAMVMAWFTTTASDNAFLFYAFMTVVGIVGFLALR